ncbi:MAG: thioredoxin family protein [Deltaproteobacteria bacterium]|nr:thioredoxin family protein [Deltaproteobacteria bacterium]
MTGRRRMFGLSAVLLTIFCLSQTPCLAAGRVVEGNVGREGQETDVKKLVAKGQYTLLDFWSPYCGPCLQIAPILVKMADKKRDLVVVKLNINRPDVQGIDWKSPLAQQYKLRSIPHLVIFDKKGKQMAAGRPAFDLFVKWSTQAGL